MAKIYSERPVSLCVLQTQLGVWRIAWCSASVDTFDLVAVVKPYAGEGLPQKAVEVVLSGAECDSLGYFWPNVDAALSACARAKSALAALRPPWHDQAVAAGWRPPVGAL